jgi:hypothetical protein
VHTLKGLVTHYVLSFIDIASRSVHIAGLTPHSDNHWMAQIARNLTDTESGFLRGARYLILGRIRVPEPNGSSSDGTRFSTRARNSWRTITPSGTIRGSKTGLCGPAQSSRHLGRCIGASASVECSTITTAALPE